MQSTPDVRAAAQVIRIPGYIADEKVHIARQYLEPQTRDDAGVPADAAEITDVAMAHLINEYARYVSLSGYERPSLTVLLFFIEQERCWD